jgi:DoxX-like family
MLRIFIESSPLGRPGDLPPDSRLVVPIWKAPSDGLDVTNRDRVSSYMVTAKWNIWGSAAWGGDHMIPDPVWPVVSLAIVQLADAAACIKPLPFVAACLEDVNWPRRLWWVLPPIKTAAAIGLIVGIWMPYLGAVTCAALVLYFVVAIAMHVRARDFGRNLLLNATGMLTICTAVRRFCFMD